MVTIYRSNEIAPMDLSPILLALIKLNEATDGATAHCSPSIIFRKRMCVTVDGKIQFLLLLLLLIYILALVFDFLLLCLTISSHQCVHISSMVCRLIVCGFVYFLSFLFACARALARILLSSLCMCSTFIRFRLQILMLRFIHDRGDNVNDDRSPFTNSRASECLLNYHFVQPSTAHAPCSSSCIKIIII